MMKKVENLELAVIVLNYLDGVVKQSLETIDGNFRRHCTELTGLSVSGVANSIRSKPTEPGTLRLISDLWVLGGLDNPLHGLFYALGLDTMHSSDSVPKLACLVFFQIMQADTEIADFVDAVIVAAYANKSSFLEIPSEKKLYDELVKLGAIDPPPAEK